MEETSLSMGRHAIDVAEQNSLTQYIEMTMRKFLRYVGYKIYVNNVDPKGQLCNVRYRQVGPE